MTEKKKKQRLVKKIAKWFAIGILTLLILLMTAPYLFKDKIKELVVNSVNESIHADFALQELDLSFLKNFPLASVKLQGVDVINKAPFQGDTLFHAEEIYLKMKLTELFKGDDEPMNIQSFEVNKGQVNILFDENGNGNYDIAVEPKADTQISDTKQSGSLSLGIQEYAINNVDFTYFDLGSKMKLMVKEIAHNGTGNFEESILDLQTKTTAKVSFEMDSTNYINNVDVSIDALLGIDLDNSKYTFKENKALIIQLPLEFEGFIQLVGENSDQLYDIEFHTPTSSFKNLLGVIPEQYSGNLKDVKTEGNFDITGTVDGTLSENSIPKFNVTFVSKDAMFQYPDLPKSVQNININSTIANTTGDLNETHVDINSLSFTIDQDVFDADAHISNLIDNPNIQLKANGIVNLAKISQAYPVQLEQELSGILKANIATNFDMESVEKKQYQNIKNSGTISLNDFVYNGKDVASPFEINQSTVSFTTNRIELQEFKAKTGETDLNVQGTLDNFYGFVFNQELLKGNFKLVSNKINVDDFMVESAETETTEETGTTQALKIPKFLDCSFQASAKEVSYDNIDLQNASGFLFVKNEAITLKDLKMNAFSGLIKMDGEVSTKDSIADFNMDLRMENLDIKQSFTQLTTLNKIAPIANVVGGKMSSDFVIDGNLSDDMTPNLQTVSGNLLGQLLNTKLNASNSKVLSFVGKELPFIDVNKLNLEKVKTYITFEDGNVVVKPFTMKYEDINIQIGGSHGFDQSMNYNITLDVPARHLGKEVTNILTKLSRKDRSNVGTVPISANLTGSFSNPKIKTDIKEATNNFAKKLVEQQKNKLIKGGADKIINLFGKKKDSTKSNKGGLLNGLLKKKKNN